MFEGLHVRRAGLTFKAPMLVLAETHRGDRSYSDWNVVYAVPTEPGRCRLSMPPAALVTTPTPTCSSGAGAAKHAS